jgi:hypothetical protein
MRVGRLARAGAITCLVAAIATVIGAVILKAVLGIDAAFMPLSIPSVAFFTVFYGVAATVVYGIVVRRASDPRRTWAIVSVIAFLLLLIPDVGLLRGPAESPMGPVTPSAVFALVCLHAIAAPIIVLGLLRLAPPD